MDISKFIAQAKHLTDKADKLTEDTVFQKTVAWFQYLGLLRHNTIKPHRHRVHLQDALRAGEAESRIYEILPAILLLLPEALVHTKADIPPDLNKVLQGIRARKRTGEFRGIPAAKYTRWLHAEVINTARRRLDFRTQPRRRGHSNILGEIIRDGRIKLAMTQKSFASTYHLSLRVIRDLEQGKMNASLKATNDILHVLGRSLRA